MFGFQNRMFVLNAIAFASFTISIELDDTLEMCLPNISNGVSLPFDEVD